MVHSALVDIHSVEFLWMNLNACAVTAAEGIASAVAFAETVVIASAHHQQTFSSGRTLSIHRYLTR
jgi:hypothetical protein